MGTSALKSVTAASAFWRPWVCRKLISMPSFLRVFTELAASGSVGTPSEKRTSLLALLEGNSSLVVRRAEERLEEDLNWASPPSSSAFSANSLMSLMVTFLVSLANR